MIMYHHVKRKILQDSRVEEIGTRPTSFSTLGHLSSGYIITVIATVTIVVVVVVIVVLLSVQFTYQKTDPIETFKGAKFYTSDSVTTHI